MGAHDAREWIDDAALRIIRIKAWKLAQSAGFTPDEKEDIEQELTLHLLRQLPKFDPQRGSRRAFISHVLERRVINLVEHKAAEKRDWKREAFSLDEQIELRDGGRIERGETLDPDLIDRAILQHPTETLDLQFEVRHAIHRLSPELAALCHLLAEPKRRNLKRLSEETGIPRGKLYELIDRIRKLFKETGLEGYR